MQETVSGQTFDIIQEKDSICYRNPKGEKFTCPVNFKIVAYDPYIGAVFYDQKEYMFCRRDCPAEYTIIDPIELVIGKILFFRDECFSGWKKNIVLFLREDFLLEVGMFKFHMPLSIDIEETEDFLILTSSKEKDSDLLFWGKNKYLKINLKKIRSLLREKMISSK